MTMIIQTLARQVPDSVYTEEGFQQMLETHIPYLLSLNTTQTRAVEPHATFKYRYDLFGYLVSIGVPDELHWIVMRMADMVSPTDFDASCTFLTYPKLDEIGRLRALYVTSRTSIGKN